MRVLSDHNSQLKWQPLMSAIFSGLEFKERQMLEILKLSGHL